MTASLDSESVKKLAEQAKGRCHSCVFSKLYDVPSGARYWCRAYNLDMSKKTRDGVRTCRRWEPFSPEPSPRTSNLETNPMIKDVIRNEDRIFWQLKLHLEDLGMDMKTAIAIAHPGVVPWRDLKWVDSLERRFGPESKWEPAQVLDRLRALGYESLAVLLDHVERTKAGSRSTRENA